MKTFKTILTCVVLFVVISAVAFSQKTTNGTGGGKWSVASTWSGGVVPSASDDVTIQASDSINFDVAITLTGKIKSLSGRVGVFDSSKVKLGSGGVYEHAVNGGTLPKFTWEKGSTCIISALTANAPSNGNQNFYNLTWNCPSQSTGLNLGMTGNTIGGDVRVINSNNQAFRLTAANVAALSGRKTITINGSVYLDSTTAFFTGSGSGSPNDTFNVVVKGNIISKGNFQLANGSGAMATWFVEGNIDATTGSFTTNSTATLADTLVFSGTTKQTFTRGGAVTSSNIRFRVKSGAIVEFDTCTLGGSSTSTFLMEKGATLISARDNGFKGNINVTGGVTFSTEGNYEYNGVVAQSDASLPATVNNLTINNPAGFTLTQPTTINGVLTLKAGVLDNTIPFTLGPSATISYQGGSLKVPVVSVKQTSGNVPEKFVMEQNYPNPFNPSTTINFSLPVSGMTTLKVYDMLGKEVAQLVNEMKEAGNYSAVFNASNLASGMYVAKLQNGNSVQMKKMMLLK